MTNNENGAAQAVQQKVNREDVANDFQTAMNGKLDDQVISSVKKQLLAATTSYPAHGSVASFIFYLQFQITITSSGGKTFNGKGGGFSTPGGGALYGDVYTDDINRLYSSTVSMQFNCAFAYTSVLFFDGNSNLLGHFESGSVSTVAGVGGGSGSWS